MKLLKSIVISCTTLAVVNGAETEQAIDLGLTVAQGNSESVLGSFVYSAANLGDTNEYLGGVSYTYGSEEGDVTNDELLAAAQWNHLLTDRTYAGLRGSLRIDTLADIDYRLSFNPFFGYYLVKNDTTYYAVEAGPGYTTEQAGGIEDDYLSLYIGQRAEHKFSESTRIYDTFSLTAPIDDLENVSITFEVGVETFLSNSLALKVSLLNNYEAKPADGAEKNDLKLITGISYKF